MKTANLLSVQLQQQSKKFLGNKKKSIYKQFFSLHKILKYLYGIYKSHYLLLTQYRVNRPRFFPSTLWQSRGGLAERPLEKDVMRIKCFSGPTELGASGPGQKKSHVCDVRVKQGLKCACIVRACQAYSGLTSCDTLWQSRGGLSGRLLEKDVMQIKYFSRPTELGASGPGGLMPPQNNV